jgi:hypothetical protein
VVFAKFDQAQGWAHQSHVLAQLKRWPEAISFADRSTAMWRDLVEQNPSVINFARFLDISFKNGVWVAEESGDKAGAQTRQMAADNFWRTHPSVKRPAK